MKETAFCWTDDELVHFSSNERLWISRVLRLAAAKPDEVHILAIPETYGGYLSADFPLNCIKISPPRVLNLTDEQSTLCGELLKAGRIATDEQEIDEEE